MSERLQWELDALKERAEEDRKDFTLKIAELRKEIKEGDERSCEAAKTDLQRVETALKKDLDFMRDDLSSIKETTEAIKTLITEGNGMAKALRWAGGAVAFAVTAVLGWMKITGKN